MASAVEGSLELHMDQLEARLTAHAEADIKARAERWKRYLGLHQNTWDAGRAELAAQVAPVMKDLLDGKVTCESLRH